MWTVKSLFIKTWSWSGVISGSRGRRGGRRRSRSCSACGPCRRSARGRWRSWSCWRRRRDRHRHCWSRTNSADDSSTNSSSRPWRSSSKRLKRWGSVYLCLSDSRSFYLSLNLSFYLCHFIYRSIYVCSLLVSPINITIFKTFFKTIKQGFCQTVLTNWKRFKIRVMNLFILFLLLHI